MVATSIGEVLLVSDGRALVKLLLPSAAPFEELTSSFVRDDALLRPAADEIHAYLAGELCMLSTPLAPSGTAFQLDVWAALCGIDYATTATYGEIARRVGRPKAMRAVGMANHVNPIALFIPCHRVIGANGALTGYAGGLALKEELLALEARIGATHMPSMSR